MKKILPLPTDRLSWLYHRTRSTCRPSRFHRIHLNYWMNMQPR
jgi:hypothetical protein